MIPGMGGMNPKKMAGMMKQLGINQEEIESLRVIIEKDDGNIVISDPQVTKVTMQGQVTWQIMGEAHEEEAESIKEEDVHMVMEQANVDEKKAREALEKADGDLAEAITSLQ